VERGFNEAFGGLQDPFHRKVENCVKLLEWGGNPFGCVLLAVRSREDVAGLVGKGVATG
jgi:hypothetical protein